MYRLIEIFMPSKKPTITIRVDSAEYQALQEWADSEFRTVPGLVLALVRKGLLEHTGQKHKSPSFDKEN
jgi:hypothetical protein